MPEQNALPPVHLARPSDAAWPLPIGPWVVLAIIGLASIALPLLVAIYARPPEDRSLALDEIRRPKPVVPRAILPEVEPVRLAALAMDDARAFNATIPFSTAPNPAARPFAMTGGAEDQGRAVDCLAAATWYEAGDDPVGQRAVAQVVLNRVRHPAFPASVCGVVFQGEERRTGCQFTFTCDGAMRRTPSAAAWGRAQQIAREALTGAVVAKVGHSTHYHTDWVVPYWSSSLDKVAEVNTHLFFRWTGWWGTPPAFRTGYSGTEPVIAKMARLSPWHHLPGAAAGMAEESAAILDPAAIPDSAVPRAAAGDPHAFYIALDRGMNPDSFAALAFRTCGDRPYCKFMGWTDPRHVPATSGALTPAQMEAMSFSYLRDQSQGYGKALWNCAEFRRASPVQCMRRTPSIAAAATPPPTQATGTAPAAGAADPRHAAAPDGLSGVRRKSDAPGAVPAAATIIPPAVPAPTPAPAPLPAERSEPR